MEFQRRLLMEVEEDGADGISTTNSTKHIPNNGSSHAEIIGLMLVEPSITLVMCMTYCFCVSFGYRSFAENFLSGRMDSKISCLTHAVIVNAIFILASTVWNEYLFTTLITISSLLLCLLYLGWTLSNSLPKKIKFQQFTWKTILNLEVDLHNRLPFVDDFRGHLLQMTAVAILAVDFDIFPVRYAKTDMYGWSVMDAGVGLFVAAHGICSSESRGKSSQSLQKSLWSSIPLFALGFVRLIAVSAVGYHQVIPEYGIHWNFFFTLAVIKVICSALLYVCPSKIDIGILALVVAGTHQWLLSRYGVTEYILQEERYTFLDKNKEGICSVLGFVTIYFGSMKVGKLLWSIKYKVKDCWYLLAKLLCTWLVLWLVSHMLHVWVQPTSRRLANIPYCIWVMSFMCLHIAVHLAHHLLVIFYRNLTVTPKPKITSMQSCALWRATNYNGLFYFLLANVLTGIVNLSMKTSEASVSISISVLYFYIAILTTVSIIMFRKSIQVKFW